MRILLLICLAAWLPARAADWQPLFDGHSLAGWKVAEFAGHGEVEVTDGALVLNQGTLTGVNYTNATPAVDYEVEWEGRRTDGVDFFSSLTFPVKDTFATLIVGGWGGAVVGISSINGEDASHNETTSYHRFKTGQWYRLRLAVTANNLSAWLDGERVVNADITGKQIALRPGEIELSKPFGFATWSTAAELRGIRLRKLGPVAAASAAEVPVRKLPDNIVAAVDRLVTAATNSPAGYARLAQLCDTFGSRFTGSTNLEAAIDWILGQMRADGFDNVRGEPVMVPHWVRGEESAELLQPRKEMLPMLGLGGSIATPWRGITAPVFVVHSVAELTNHAKEAAGKIVVFDVPYTDYGETVAIRFSGAIQAAKAGAKASLIRSITPFALRTPHTGMMTYDTNVTKIPHAALAPEDTARLARWQERGIAPVIRLKMSARTLKDVPSRNVVAELRGRAKPDEVIVVGGHIDSWDVGQGAQDDGGGCLAAWEAVRLIKQLGLRPRRTIRVVLWTNEETGGAGSKAYRKAHLTELPQHVAALETDIGTFPPEGFGFTGSTAAMETIRAIGGLLGERLQAGKVVKGAGEADIAPLLQEGVPNIGLRVDRTRYFWYHHTAADTVDKVAPQDLQRCTAALAVMVYTLAEMEEPLPR
ncbi:MAG TPA: M20/M25/M40 family metallo-hydrolase [Candidatus Limnocylindria bacterium]|nr:M20/M25/M40 family metallo-hydrolase [Candidatus Limnocylindria bacterium]